MCVVNTEDRGKKNEQQITRRTNGRKIAYTIGRGIRQAVKNFSHNIDQSASRLKEKEIEAIQIEINTRDK
jgi:hypothetical protein